MKRGINAFNGALVGAILFLAVPLTGVAGVAIEVGDDEGTISIASFNRVLAQAADQVLLVDVRDPEELTDGTLKGAINIPIDLMEEKVASLPADKPIIFVCGTGGRAGEAYDLVQMLRSELEAYFLDAEVTFHKNGSVEVAPSI